MTFPVNFRFIANKKALINKEIPHSNIAPNEFLGSQMAQQNITENMAIPYQNNKQKKYKNH